MAAILQTKLIPGSRLVDWLFVRRDVERIFQFRRERLLALLGKPA